MKCPAKQAGRLKLQKRTKHKPRVTFLMRRGKFSVSKKPHWHAGLICLLITWVSTDPGTESICKAGVPNFYLFFSHSVINYLGGFSLSVAGVTEVELGLLRPQGWGYPLVDRSMTGVSPHTWGESRDEICMPPIFNDIYPTPLEPSLNL